MMPDEPTRAKGIGSWTPPRSSSHFRHFPTPRSSPFIVTRADLHSSLTHLCSSLASHRLPLRWFAAVLVNPLFPGALRPGSGLYPLPQPNRPTIRLIRVPQKLSVIFSDFSHV